MMNTAVEYTSKKIVNDPIWYIKKLESMPIACKAPQPKAVFAFSNPLAPSWTSSGVDLRNVNDVVEITEEGFPEWFALAMEAMGDYEEGRVEPCP